MSYRGEVGELVESGRGDGEISTFEWRIPDFLSLAAEGGDHYNSPSFDACDGRWCFAICPKELWQKPPSNWVSLLLWRLSYGPPQTLDLILGIRGPERVENKKGRRQEFSDDDRACFWYTFCSRLKMSEQKSVLMPGDVLTVNLDMKSVVPSIARGTETLVKDFGKLLSSGENSDVTVQVGEVEFKVHRAILSARSPVLSAMFKHETEERATNRITVEDCESEVFKEYLQYLYTGSVGLLSEQNVFHLYRVADKYLVDELKEQCLMQIRDTLSVQTFCDTLKVALMHGEGGLLEQVIDFATENIRSIIRTVEWENFNREYPNEANEVLIKSLGPPSISQKSKRQKTN